MRMHLRELGVFKCVCVYVCVCVCVSCMRLDHVFLNVCIFLSPALS